MPRRLRPSSATRVLALGLAIILAAAVPATSLALGVSPSVRSARTTTPIKHLVVIFQENVSFDHYFGTYPVAANTSGQTFTARTGTPAVNGLTGTLLTANPNGVNPRRYDPANVSDVITCDQDHNYADEQKAFDNGAMNKFVATLGAAGKSPEGATCVPGDVMNYYDGNSVTALWNYAQQFAMSDNSFGTTFGPSAPGAINLVSGDTGAVDVTREANNPTIATATAQNADITPDGLGGFSLTSDAQPYFDDCSTRDAVAMTGQNIGDELNAAGISWGWFQGGFRPTTPFATAAATVGHHGQSTSAFIPDEFKTAGFQNGVPHSSNQGICDAVHAVGIADGGTGQYGYKDDYIAHHEPFQYYASTANPHHLTVATNSLGQDTIAGLRSIGKDTQGYQSGIPKFNTPNHQYDTSDWNQLVTAIAKGRLPGSALPAVSFLKAPGYQDGHAAYSDPLDEQTFVVDTINALQATPDWSSTAVVISYDDSDGWYDHVDSGVTNPSTSVADALTGTGACGTGTPLAGEQGRCGYGPRLPLLVISPWARSNAVDHTLTDQSSILRFVEDNWTVGRISGSTDALAGPLGGLFDFSHPHGTPPNNGAFLLDPVTGQIEP